VQESSRPFVTVALDAARGSLGPELSARLYELPERAELDGILVVHGSPISDIETFAPDPQPGEERMLGGETKRTILFGHSHQQFRRAGPDGTALVNPGSVGMPLDRDPRAAWALFEQGELRFRRAEYDVDVRPGHRPGASTGAIPVSEEDHFAPPASQPTGGAMVILHQRMRSEPDKTYEVAAALASIVTTTQATGGDIRLDIAPDPALV